MRTEAEVCVWAPTRVCIRRSSWGGVEEERGNGVGRALVRLLALKTEERTTSQGNQATSRSWKGQGNGFFPRGSEGT